MARTEIVQSVFDFAIREINALEVQIVTAEDDADAMLWEQARQVVEQLNKGVKAEDLAEQWISTRTGEPYSRRHVFYVQKVVVQHAALVPRPRFRDVYDEIAHAPTKSKPNEHAFRPITDVWILARAKVKYYGAYPAGFLHRARALLGVRLEDPVLHVCGGRVREYPYAGVGPADKTLDLDPACAPDYLQDARNPLPPAPMPLVWWPAVLIDRPYTLDDAAQYAPGADAMPKLNVLLKNALGVVAVGARVGVLDYLWPNPPKDGKEVAVVAVGTGRNGRARWYTVFERMNGDDDTSLSSIGPR